MPTLPLVSIIVPVYNASSHLRRCIDSILKQTYKNFELLLIDDGSTDSSGEICDEYSKIDNRVRSYHKPNGGVSSARNYGLLRIRGGYLTFVDSDDWVEENHVTTMAAYISDYDWVMLGMKYINSDNSVQDVKNVSATITVSGYNELDSVCPKLPQFCWVTNKLYKSDLIRLHKLTFMEESHIHEDRIFNLNYLQYINSLVMLPEVTYNYLVNPSSLSHKKYCNPEMFIFSAERMNLILQKKTLGKIMSEYVAKFMCRFYIHTFGCCIIYPRNQISFTHRHNVMKHLLKSLLKSELVKGYHGKLMKWMLCDLWYYVRRIVLR